MNIKIEDLKKLFITDTPLIDVRAPVEFAQGSLPGAVNLPILNDEERALIGTTYKKHGQEEAVRLGYQIISGSVKEGRVAEWSQFVAEHPEVVLYCFRGGKRSQITQQWLKEAGIVRPLIVGGYKAARQFLMTAVEDFSAQKDFLVVSGPTGSGKTTLLNDVLNFYPSLDLESLAHHRGSAFGSWSIPQPTQVDFENQLAVGLLKLETKLISGAKLLVEDESRLIGKNCLPESFFNRLRSSEVVWLEEPLNVRVENIFKDYIAETVIGDAVKKTQSDEASVEKLRAKALELFENYKKALMAISRKLGGLRTQEVMVDLETARLDFLNKNELEANKQWIEKLLVYYYDPLYLKSLERRQVKVCFRGPKQDVIDYLKNLKF
ncbi:MAG: tRNA 2-selenouridine(34) synthase MnmH [Bdellovibrio sp.]